MPIGVKDSRRHRYIGEKKSAPMHIIGNKQYLGGNKSKHSVAPKDGHDIYEHHSNSGFVQRMPMLHTGHKEPLIGGHVSHIEKQRKKDHSDHFI